MQVVDVNMTQDNFCPGAWRMITSPKKLCVGGVNGGCDSAVFNTRGLAELLANKPSVAQVSS